MNFLENDVRKDSAVMKICQVIYSLITLKKSNGSRKNIINVISVLKYLKIKEYMKDTYTRFIRSICYIDMIEKYISRMQNRNLIIIVKFILKLKANIHVKTETQNLRIKKSIVFIKRQSMLS